MMAAGILSAGERELTTAVKHHHGYYLTYVLLPLCSAATVSVYSCGVQMVGTILIHTTHFTRGLMFLQQLSMLGIEHRVGARIPLHIVRRLHRVGPDAVPPAAELNHVVPRHLPGHLPPNDECTCRSWRTKCSVCSRDGLECTGSRTLGLLAHTVSHFLSH